MIECMNNNSRSELYLDPGVVLWIINETHRIELMALGSFIFTAQFISHAYVFSVDWGALNADSLVHYYP